MKNAGKHSDELKQLFKRLSRDAKPDPRPVLEPLEALVRGAMSYDVTDSRAADAMKAISKEFVDLNELRVATDLEVHEMLGVRYPAIEERVAMITQCLNAIFEREQTMNLDRLKSVSKRETRQFLRELPGIHPYVEAYIMLFAFEGSAFPLDEEMLQFLRDQEILDEEIPLPEAQRFLETHIKAEDIYDYYAVLRKAAQSDGAKKKARS